MKPRRPPVSKPRDLHLAWLALVDTEGPFLAIPPLLRVWPQGMAQIADAAKLALTDAKPVFERVWDDLDRHVDQKSLDRYRKARDAWVDVVLRDVLGWGDLWIPRDSVAEQARATAPNHAVTVTATGALRKGDAVGALVWVIDPVAGMRDPLDDGWASSPVDRMEVMLREAGVPVGLVTDGRWWVLVSAPSDTLPASGVLDSLTWVEEPVARDAFAELMSVRRLIGGAAQDRLSQLFEESVLAAEEITDSLGVQVRKAVELLVQAFAEGAEAAEHSGEESPLPADGDLVYQASVTVMMRVVFLLFAEERELLPEGQVFAQGYGLTGVLDALDDRIREEGPEALDGTHLVWHRLLATSQALYRGASFEDLRLPAYGGSLFDPSRFEFLHGTTESGTLALVVSDRVMRHVLDAVQVARVRGQEARRLSFRDVDVEQIGYIYEGLLGYTCQYVDRVTLGLIGKDGREPEIPLALLEVKAQEGLDDKALAAWLRTWAAETQPASESATAAQLAKALAAGDSQAGAEQALRLVTADEVLRDRLRPWLGATRRDLRDRPMVVKAGGLLVVETPSRRNAGAHYTPRALAEEVVLHALEPVVYDPGPHQTADRSAWRLKSPTEILSLKVADIACGSGAFLVAAARYLADRLVEAWRQAGQTAGLNPHELETRALREVVAHCLYGADINPMAVEMCKLSLWLVSLDRDLPFSFVDDKVLCGNALLGLTSLTQLEALQIDPPIGQQGAMFEVSGSRVIQRLDVTPKIAHAIRLREALASEVVETDPQRNAAAKRHQLEELHGVTKELRHVADGVVAAGLALGGKPGRALTEAYENLAEAVSLAYPAEGVSAPAMLNGLIDVGLTPTIETDYDRWQPLHWALEVPDVMARGGFDAVVGNPPFKAGKEVSNVVGGNVREWLVNILAYGARGNADLVAYFFLRAVSMLTSSGTMGLIATNTVAQGDTREVGLDQLVQRGLTITRSIQSQPWPTRSADLECAVVWGTKRSVDPSSELVSDGRRVSGISTMLDTESRFGGKPTCLRANLGQAFIGSNVNGMGFTLREDVARRMIAVDDQNSQVLRPFLNGKDLNATPLGSASRWIVDFFDLPETKAVGWTEPWAWVKENVYPERLKLTKKPALQQKWWRYERLARGLRIAIADLSEVLAITVVSKTVMPLRVSADQVFSHALCVFATDRFDDQALLSSSLHQLWAITHGSGMRNDPRYTPSDVFETFPRPEPTDDLDRMGRTLDAERRQIMLRRGLGLTKLYNLVNDPDIKDGSDKDVARLREIHVELDEAVMAAFGWHDVLLDHGFHTYRQMERWTVSPMVRVEILDRLLEENHRRAAIERGETS